MSAEAPAETMTVTVRDRSAETWGTGLTTPVTKKITISAATDEKGGPAPHILVISINPPKRLREFRFECPGIEVGQCRTWWECMVDGCDPEADPNEDGMAHGVEHTSMNFGWAVPSEDCWLQNYDEAWDSILDMFAEADREPDLGRYVVKHAVGVGDVLELELIEVAQ